MASLVSVVNTSSPAFPSGTGYDVAAGLEIGVGKCRPTVLEGNFPTAPTHAAPGLGVGREAGQGLGLLSGQVGCRPGLQGRPGFGLLALGPVQHGEGEGPDWKVHGESGGNGYPGHGKWRSARAFPLRLPDAWLNWFSWLFSPLVREVPMSRQCEICGKKPQFGNNVSHSNNITKRRWNPNIQRVRALVSGAPKRLRVCTSCIQAGKVIKNV